jgi:hypothetical protein
MDWTLINARKGELWREGRKLLDRDLRPGEIMSYRQMMQDNTRWFLSWLLATPNEFRGHIGLSVVSLPYPV